MNNYSIYKHTFPNGKVYIGATKLPIEIRWGKNGRGYPKGQPRMFEAIMEFGWANVTHEILFENLSEEEAMAKEIELIKEHDSTNPQFGYNRSFGGKGRGNFPRTDETRAKMRASHLGTKKSPESIAKMKATCASRPKKVKPVENIVRGYGRKVLQLDPTTKEVIREWNNVKEICSTLGLSQAGISRSCIGRYEEYNGFVWKYVEKPKKNKHVVDLQWKDE